MRPHTSDLTNTRAQRARTLGGLHIHPDDTSAKENTTPRHLEHRPHWRCCSGALFESARGSQPDRDGRRRSGALFCARTGDIYNMSIGSRLAGCGAREGRERGSEIGLLQVERPRRTSSRAKKYWSAADAADLERGAAGGCGIARSIGRVGFPTATPRVRPSHGARRRREEAANPCPFCLLNGLSQQTSTSGHQNDVKKSSDAAERRVGGAPHRPHWCHQAGPRGSVVRANERVREKGAHSVTHCVTS